MDQPVNATRLRSFGDDQYLIELCAAWHIARAEHQLIRAKHDAKDWFDPDGPTDIDFAPFKRMKELQVVLAKVEPRTAFLAQQLLHIVTTILAHPDRESELAQGPCIDMVRNVVRALDYCDGNLSIGTACLNQNTAPTDHQNGPVQH